MKRFSAIFTILIALSSSLWAQDVKPTKILIINVEIFNGRDAKTTKGNVLMESWV